MNWTPTRWTLEGSDPMRPITINRVAQKDGPDRYSIYDSFNSCLDRKGRWRWEPMPSSRTEAFFKAFRFATFEEAAEIAQKYLKVGD